ncbi:Histidine phosphatase superfamily clade-2 [Penicillium cinerascens]|uniref:Histidine phosphatase superfamily clade-2 n=1 Tax=Penicillium cinerascens TaxID=70096 RepID=A0A9W9M7T0_9EURO|nr:Histidine phosphatase superfamily clade-2 [Penicillium cinerascens]KAJ5191993.1 Histidine phosphatase superfamily clade-2 [Penicillium cinerascens]
MRYSLQSGLILAACIAAPVVDAERVLGAYLYSRHGDRTAKVLGNTQLTDLGYHEVFSSGSFYHDRYIAAGSDEQIEGISEPIVNPNQISASAPDDAVLQNSATGFLQGVYPPALKAASQTLGNGTFIQSPLDGYQIIQLQTTDTSQDSESSAWLQGSSDCSKATVSSNNYYLSDSYMSMLASTKDFYTSLSPMLNGAFGADQMSFKNAYTIFDYLNVGYIHNSTKTFPLRDNLTTELYGQLLQLASNQQYNLAFNESDPVRAIDGAVLAGEILSQLNKTITSDGKTKLGVQFGSYGTFMSFFGLMQLPVASVNFTGICDYASTFVLELVTNATGSGIPSTDDISVRFMFHNGTITGSDEPTVYPLFGQRNDLISWDDFKTQTEKIAILSDDQWCNQCGNTGGKCASSASTSSTSDSTGSSSSGSGGMSRAVAGVIGAMVTLAVILGLEALFFLVGGFRIAKRRKSGPEMSSSAAVAEDK